jgi:RecA-family ATPase/DNA polymerase I-like protein with 3'-5' exonuclease and polymerase domains
MSASAGTPATSDKLRSVFDIETDALNATTVHCVVIAELDADCINEYGPTEIDAALAHLARADCLIGHNILGFDLAALRKLHNWTPAPTCTIIDTLIAGRLILPHIGDLDAEIKARSHVSLGTLHGSYKLEAWGIRLGIPKIGADIEDFSTYTLETLPRCVGDVAICKALHRALRPDGYSQRALELEHRVAVICNEIVAAGVPFDRRAAEQRHRQWTARRAELGAALSQQFPGTNLNSHKQIGALLEARGWTPKKRTEKTNQPVIDDEVLETIPTLFPEFAGIAEYELLRRRIAQLATGKQAWLNHVGADGRIHGGLIHIGTPHSRAKHLAPNIAQVPNPKKGAPYAAECRALFRHPGDWVFVTCDQSNLQDRAFAHYLAEFDGGAYARDFLVGFDRHWHNATALELVPTGTERNKESKIHTTIREGAKTFHYGSLFGAGAGRCKEILTDLVRAVRNIDASYTAPTDGKRARARFIAATPGLARLRNKLERQVAQHGWLPGLDGRRVPTRAKYTALNYALASIEAIVCKRWLVNVYDELCARFRYGWDSDVVVTLWIHDEIAAVCRPEIAEQVGEILVRHAKEAGEHYRLKVPLDAEYKIGRSWAGETTASATAPIAETIVNLPFTDTTPIDVETQIVGGDIEDEPDIADDDDSEPDVSADRDELARLLDEISASVVADTSLTGVGAAPDVDHRENGGDGAVAGATVDRLMTYFENLAPSFGAGARNANNYDRDGYSSGEQDTGQQVAFFIYRHADGTNYLGIKKTSTKQYPQFHWTGSNWARGKPNGLKIPYRLPELIRAPVDDWVLICAGEKDAETAARLGFVATTNPEGERKGAWAPELNPWFAGRKRVAIMEDNDTTGRTHTLEVANALRGIVPDIRIVTFRELPEHGDLTDWKERGHRRDDLLAKIEATKPYCRKPPISPIRDWDDKPAPEIMYGVADRFPLKVVCLFSGEGGGGKSTTTQQLAVAHALEREWLGCVPRKGPAIYVECEDPEDVLHWRQKAIAEHYGVTQAAIADAGFHMLPLADAEESAILATAPDKSGIVHPTPLYDQLYEMAGDIKPVMIGIASAAIVFAGNENVRPEVQQFMWLLRRLARVSGGYVLLVAQPSLTGIGDGSVSHAGLSGTTQWHNGSRGRAVLRAVKPEGEDSDTGLREIKFYKNQYGPLSASCFVRYTNGLFLPVEGMSMDAATRAARAEEVFITLLRRFTAQRQVVSHASGRNYAPARFAEHPEAQGITRREFAQAMQRLLDARTIEIRTWGRPSRPVYYLALTGEG